MARDSVVVAQGKTVKIFTVGKKGNDALKRLYGKYVVEHVDFRSVKQMSFAEAQSVASKVLAMFHNGEFDVATDCASAKDMAFTLRKSTCSTTYLP